ncbi:hypothetical protein SMC26_23540 [Actinomadura fulvescens]|uniref:hypothetical protein n=1 Tax=Actinomadura fulvescens TaxID=46160 RepID=UPI0031CDFC19
MTALVAVTSPLVACTADSPAKPSRTPGTEAYSGYRVARPSALARLGVSADGRAFRLGKSGAFAVAEPVPNGVLLSIPRIDRQPPRSRQGGTVTPGEPHTNTKTAPMQAAILNPADGRITRIPLVKPDHELASFYIAPSGAFVWVETRQSSSPCADPEFGCFTWSLYVASQAGGPARLIAEEKRSSPKRGVPDPKLSGETVCWAQSTNNRHWTVTRQDLTAQAKPMTSRWNTWVDKCVPSGRGIVVSQVHGFAHARPGKFAVGTIDLRDETGKHRRLGKRTEEFALHGTQLAYIRNKDPEQGTGQVWLTSLADSRSARKLLDKNEGVDNLVWIDDHRLMVKTTHAWLLLDTRTGERSQLLGDKEGVVWPTVGYGKFVYGNPIEPGLDIELRIYDLPAQ